MFVCFEGQFRMPTLACYLLCNCGWLLPASHLPNECWVYRCGQPHLVFYGAVDRPQGSLYSGKRSSGLSAASLKLAF